MLPGRSLRAMVMLAAVTAVGLSAWFYFTQATALFELKARELAANRFKSYCLEIGRARCDSDFVFSTEQRFHDGWLIEYQRTKGRLEIIAFFVHDNMDVEISKYEDDPK